MDAKSLSSWEVSDPVRFRLECGASTSESFPAGDVQTRSLKVIQVIGLIHVLIGLRHGLRYHSPEAEIAGQESLGQGGQGRLLGDRMPNIPLWVANGKEGGMQWGKCADTQRTIARLRSAEGRVRRSIINVGKDGQAATWQIPGRPIWGNMKP